MDFSQLTSKTAICGYVIFVAVGAAFAPGMEMSVRYLAGVVALIALLALCIFVPDADKTITTKQIMELPDNEPIKKSDLVKPDPSAAVKVDHSSDASDFTTNTL
jgi:hypothetical protein